MPPPKEIKVLGFTYTVQFVSSDESGGDKLGWCDFTNLQIYIINGQPKSGLANTFLHEVIHAVNYCMGITSGKEEQLTNRLANGFCAVWKENPEALKWWSDLLKEPAKRRRTRKVPVKKKSRRRKPRSRK